MPAIDSTIQLRKPPPSGCDDILSAGALDFLAALAHRFEPRRRELLERRRLRQAELDAGHLPDFLPDTRSIREDAWTVARIPPDLRDRRVEITGPRSLLNSSTTFIFWWAIWLSVLASSGAWACATAIWHGLPLA